MKRLILLMVLGMQAGQLFAQAPVIFSVEPLKTNPLSTVKISGTGFSSSPAALQVWFDHVQGTITSSSATFIEVTVPAQAKYHNVEVINLTTRLSAKSIVKVLPSFSGESFDATKFQSQDLSTNAVASFDICTCDLDGDGKPDIVGTKNVAGTDLLVLHNKSTPGTPNFDKYEKGNLPALTLNQSTEHAACGDLNGDGKPDVVVTRAGATANSLYVLRNTSTTTPNFAAFVELFLDLGHTARQVVIQDLNGDGKPEIIVANSAAAKLLYVFVNQSSGGTLSINPTPVKISLATGAANEAPNTLALEVQDFDGDGRPDIIASQNQGANLFFLKNQSGATISFGTAQTIITGGGTFNDVNSADFNNDGKLDLVVTSVFSSQAIILLNKTSGGTVSFSGTTEQIVLTAGTGPFGAEVADLNGDGFEDVIITNRSTSSIHAFIHSGNTTAPAFTKFILTTLPKFSWFSRVADFDGDAKPDIVFTSAVATGSNFITMLRNKHCHQPVILTEGPLTICPGQTFTLEAIQLPGVTYDWKKDGVSFKSSPDAFADVTAAGSYTVTAIGESGTCSLTSSAFVISSGTGTIPTTAVINPITPACLGSAITINASPVSGATYIWSGPNGLETEVVDNPQLVIANASAAQAGFYTLKLKIGDCIGDEDTEQASVIDVGNFAVTSSATGPVCEGTAVTLTVNSSTGRTYQWIKDGADLAGQTSTSHVTNLPGSYAARVSFSGCSKETAALPVVIRTKPVAAFTVKANACVGEELTFTNTSTADAQATVQYAWNFGDGTTSTSQSPSHAYTSAAGPTASLTVTYSGITSCESTSSQTLAITAAVIPEIIASAPEICAGSTETLSLSGTFTMITWNTNETTNTIEITEAGIYTVETTDAGGCSGEDEIEILAKTECGSAEFNIPKGFSPNGDTQNDTWIITGIENISECSIKVFDERGMAIYEKVGYEPSGWDGTFNGKIVPDGVYYYVLTCPDTKPIKGSVLIVK